MHLLMNVEAGMHHIFLKKNNKQTDAAFVTMKMLILTMIG
jgi:hypothetical protein